MLNAHFPGLVYGPVGHATHYHADYVLPYWADSLDKQLQIGRHIFYRLRGTAGSAAAFSQRHKGLEPIPASPGAAEVALDAIDQVSVGAVARIEPETGIATALPPPLEADKGKVTRLDADERRGSLILGGGEPSPTVAKAARSGCVSSRTQDVKILPVQVNEL